ncbi:WAT1-related protein [Gossypium australe]|uniref:WAT1-related protein n=1 Tax=Gossypium australe TaxID=47621 RepID=A0A5B6V5A8_9ROSI|nr:WAT1-related protein [Gossypium australe]
MKEKDSHFCSPFDYCILFLRKTIGKQEIQMARRYCYNDVLPLTAMVAIECTNVGLNVLFKKATSKGMSYFIFITYAIGALLLLPLSFLFPSRPVLPSLKFHLGFRIFLLGLIGNPTLASTISNLSPAFTFILAVLFRCLPLPNQTKHRF